LFIGIAASLLGAMAATPAASAAQSAVGLGTATSFAVLAGTTVTNTGPSKISGDLGVSPGTAVTGFPPGVVTNGSVHGADGVAQQAQSDLTTAYDNAAGRTPATTLSPSDLGGRTLAAGVYKAPSALGLTGTVTLDGENDPDAVFIFQAGSTLTTAPDSTVKLIRGAQACNVFWQVGSSATLGTDTTFVGSILALTSATVQTRATVAGRVLARNGQVSLDTNTITRPTCNSATTPTPTSPDGSTGGTGGTGTGTGQVPRTGTEVPPGSSTNLGGSVPGAPLARSGSPIDTTLLLAALALTLGAVARRLGRTETAPRR
jgi:ice-binding like protein